jgi:hypothetical protein
LPQYIFFIFLPDFYPLRGLFFLFKTEDIMRIASSITRITAVFFVFFIITSIFTEAYGQQWKRYRKEYLFGAGITNFLGELGGANQVGTNFLRDLEWTQTRPALCVGYKYNVTAYSKVRASLFWGILSGNDNLTEEPFRNNRNLHFRSHVVELNGIYEYYFNSESSGHRYNIKGARGMKAKKFTYYAFGGVGVFFFNPQAQYNGQWVSLQPLGTEGQGLPGGGSKYSRVSIAIPYGLGLRYAIDRDWKIGLEVGARKTFTDYIDDVSGNYYDNTVIRNERGDMAAALADPSKGMFAETQYDPKNGRSKAGIQRGDPKDKDTYMFLMVTASYRIKKKGSRAKF